MHLFRLISFLALITLVEQLHSQSNDSLVLNTRTYIIETTDGGKIIGTILSKDEVSIIVKTTTMGAVTILRSSVLKISSVDGKTVQLPSIWYENPGRTRYLVGPSAIPLRKGESYYQNMYLLLSGFNYGFTDHFSLKVGTELASPLLDRDAPAVICISPRIGYRIRPNLFVGGAVLYTLFPRQFVWGATHHFIFQGMATVGNTDNNFTVGLSWSCMSDLRYVWQIGLDRQMAYSTIPSVSLSGMVRLTQWLGFVTENWYYSQPVFSGGGQAGLTASDVYYSAGFRGIGRNFTVDAGIMNSTDWGYFRFGFPYAGFTVHFGNKRWHADAGR